MGIKPFREIPKDAVEWSRFLQSADVEASDGTITDETFANRAPNSIIGRPSGSAGAPSDIVAAADGRFLTRRAGTLQFDGLLDADIPSGIARDTEVSAAIATHVAEIDPHTQYRLEADAVPYAQLSGVPAVIAFLFRGAGSPEGVLTAGVGSLYLRSDGGAGTTLYVKESGAGNTGWVAK